MAWNAVFPLGSTFINQSVPQFQANWAFINTNVNTDHYFNSGAPNEGHHRFSQYVNQAGDPALLASGEIYVKPNPSAGTIQPFYRNAVNIFQIPMMATQTQAMGAPAANFPLFPITAAFIQNPAVGFFTVVQSGGAGNFGSGAFAWDGANLTVTQLSVTGTPLGGLYGLGSAIFGGIRYITISQNVGGLTNWQCSILAMLP